MRPPWLAAALVALVILAAPAPPAEAVVGGWHENPQSRVRLVSPWTVAPDGENTLGLELRLAPGWHSYWKNPGDAGFPPRLLFPETPGVAEAHLLFPAPHRYPLPGDLEAFGYEDQVVYPVKLRLRAEGQTDVALAAHLDYLVCEVECVPYRYELGLLQPTGAPALVDPEGEAVLRPWLERLPVPVADSGLAVRQELRRAGDGYLLVVEVPGAGGEGDPDLFLEPHDLFEADAPSHAAAAGGVRLELPLRPTRRDVPLPDRVRLAWTATGLRGAGVPPSLEGEAVVALASAPRARAWAVAPAAAAGVALALLAGRALRRRSQPPNPSTL
jgi:suppressor for copper-sensitivity B